MQQISCSLAFKVKRWLAAWKLAAIFSHNLGQLAVILPPEKTVIFPFSYLINFVQSKKNSLQ